MLAYDLFNGISHYVACFALENKKRHIVTVRKKCVWREKRLKLC